MPVFDRCCMYNVTLLCNNNVQILGGNFMASQQTPNYKLSRWAGTDRILMEDFNADNEKIEAALAAHAARLAGVGNCKIEYGTYIGDGTYGQAHQQTLTFRRQAAAGILNLLLHARILHYDAGYIPQQCDLKFDQNHAVPSLGCGKRREMVVERLGRGAVQHGSSDLFLLRSAGGRRVREKPRSFRSGAFLATVRCFWMLRVS